ncbi:ABC transporter ATP-binding protein [Apilactobacillus kunkeei]|uniref:ABC transporter ATP-binding protein n=1 Tax=Apilactobacillus kunkeei TaxID=148814 RepID=UPI00265829A1|nr:ABC transporter ATP-binding protein [Apilactobacillus kunkeei]
MLKIENISKSFSKIQALNNLSFEAKDGQILGLIGQNGAGKSTTFHSILRFIEFDGKITLNNHEITVKDFNEVGYLPEERSLFEDLTIESQITYFAELKGRDKKWVKERIDSWLKRFEVKGEAKDKIKSLSKGNQQKVQLICTLIHEPKLVILDEPFSGLDPVNADLLKKEIIRTKENGAAIIFSSHDMNNVEELCDHVVMLRNGNVVLNGSVDEIRNQFGKKHVFVTTDMSVNELAALDGVSEIVARGHNRYKITLTDEEYGKALFNAVSRGEYIEEFSQQPPTLDEIFREKAVAKHA